MTSWDQDNDDLLRTAYLNSDDILERVDEYSLYCHYLGYEPIPHTGKYRSPIRIDDEIPSFGIFYTDKNPDREFLWKDQATGQVGDIFKLVQLMYQYRHIRDAEKKIIKDFALGQHDVEDKQRIIYHNAPSRTLIDIRVTPRAFLPSEVDYWSQYNIDQALLSMYNVSAVKYYWLAAEQAVPYAPREFAFAYRIWRQYKIYQPFAGKEIKFRNNFTDQHIEGLVQLKYQSPLLVITKALKDVMFFASIGIEAISPRSENTPILQRHLKALEGKYRHLITWFDNDGKHRADFYPNYPHYEVPLSTGEKDPTDFAKRYGIAQARSMVMDTLNQYL
jgi:hypothetical protein